MTSPTPQPVIRSVFLKLGGQQTLGTEVTSEADLARIVNRGIRPAVLAYVLRAGLFSQQEIQHFIIPARTLRHRKTQKKPLSMEEFDRIVRFARVQALAEDAFGDAKKANRWLREGLGIL